MDKDRVSLRVRLAVQISIPKSCFIYLTLTLPGFYQCSSGLASTRLGLVLGLDCFNVTIRVFLYG
jgi:hypothetical protein